MIFLATPIYDVSGLAAIDSFPSNPYEGQRRGSVTKTLDGAVSVYDTGYCVADQIFSVKVNRPTQELLEKLRYFVAYYPQIYFACEVGFYSSLLSFALKDEALTIRLQIISQLN